MFAGTKSRCARKSCRSWMEGFVEVARAPALRVRRRLRVVEKYIVRCIAIGLLYEELLIVEAVECFEITLRR